MPPAARVTDMHTCPMVTGVVPHVGGPILPPGVPTVLIDFLPAANVTTMATCVGPPDIIVMGSAGVFINFLPAARIGDLTAHGGVIVLGSPTCIIGEIGSPSPGAAGLGGIVAGLAAAGASNPMKPNASVYTTPGTSSSSPYEPEDSTDPATSESKKAKTTGNSIDITFEPDKSKKIKKCDRIVHVQFNRQYADDKVIKPGDYYAGFKYQDAVTTGDGWVIDHLNGETTPDYQQGTGDGKKNGGTVDAKITDGPNTSGGDKGFYDPNNNKGGWKKIKYEFATFAWCMKGPDCGTWYEGVEWTYTKTWEDARDGKKGESKVGNDNVTAAPSASQIEAFNKFNKDKGFSPCT